VNISEKTNQLLIALFLVTIASIISYTYYFDHSALAISLIQNDEKIYEDKTNLFYLIHKISPSLLFNLINFLTKIGVNEEQINIFLTSLTTLFSLSGIYLVSKYLTSSTLFSLLISCVCILLRKNFGDIDYPTLMFSEHTMGQIGQSLCTLIFGLLTLKNLLYAYLFCVLLLSIHSVLGIWMIGVITITSCLTLKKFNYKKISFISFFTLIIIFYYLNFLSTYNEISYEFIEKDYEEFFFYIEAHRNNYGNLNIFHFDYITQSLFLVILIMIFLKYDRNSPSINNNLFLKTLLVSIIFSSLIYFTYKIFPNIFPSYIVKIIPQRFFLTHSIIGYALTILLIYKLLELLLRYFKYDYSLLLKIFSIIVTLHLFQQHESVNNRFQNFKNIQDNLVEERIFWKKVNDLNLTGYVLSNNPTCNKVIIYTKMPILFCFYMLDNLSYFPNLITPSKKITHDILDISFKDVKNRNLGGIIDPEIKKIYEEKSFENWKDLNDKLFLNTVIVPNDWTLDIENLLLDDLYKVYKIN